MKQEVKKNDIMALKEKIDPWRYVTVNIRHDEDDVGRD